MRPHPGDLTNKVSHIGGDLLGAYHNLKFPEGDLFESSPVSVGLELIEI